MAKYTRIEIWRICIFWFLVGGIIFLILASVLAVAGVDRNAYIAVFAIGVILLVPAAVLWLIVKVRQRNRKIVSQ